MELTFGEQIKILLSRSHMTIQELADRYETVTGNKMSRQNLTQRLKRDNFPEQDMRVLAALLGCRVSIQLEPAAAMPFPEYGQTVPAESAASLLNPGRLPLYSNLSAADQSEEFTDISPADPADMQEEALCGQALPDTEQPDEDPELSDEIGLEPLSFEIPEAFRRQKPQGDINPLTGREYLTNTVRKHPAKPGYIQVYDQKAHAWSDVRENYFWEFQERKKQILGSDYQEPLVI